MNNYNLDHYVKQSLNVQDLLYEVEDTLSEATMLECFNHNQRRLRDNGYKNLAYNFLIEHSLYHEWRMQHPLKHNYKNLRSGVSLTTHVIIGEDSINSSKMVKFEPWDIWLEGNTIHKR